jgi:PPOX class probable F420-dependent enzyme
VSQKIVRCPPARHRVHGNKIRRMMGPMKTAPIPERARSILTGLRVGFVATTRPDGQLSVVPVGVMLDGDVLRISTPSDTFKVRNLRADPHVAVCVADPQDARHYVEVRGTAELADDVDRSFIDWIAREYMGADEYPYESRDVGRTVITVHPTRISMPRVHGSPKED